MPRFSANLGFLFADRPLPERIVAAAACGFDAVEMHWPYDEDADALRAALDRAGLPLLALNSPFGDASRGEFGLAALPGRERDARDAFARSLHWARRLGARAIHVVAGLVGEGGRAVHEAVFLDALGRAADEAAAHGLVLLLEPMNRHDRPGYLLTTPQDAADIIVRLGRANVRMMLDAYHTGREGLDPLAEFERHAALVGHVQAARVPDRAEPEGGDVDYPAFFARLDALGYPGFVGAEYRPAARTEDGLGWLSRARAGGRAVPAV